MPFGSRPKGSKAELEIAAKLQVWWRQLSPNAIFKRVPLSGGWGDANARAAFRSAGDVMTDCLKFPFTIEVKRREGWSWSTLLAGKASPVWGYWKQAVDQAREMGGIPLMFFRRNREDWSLMLPHHALIHSKLFPVGEDVTMAWYTSVLERYAGGVHPIVVTAEWFFRSPPQTWARVALTFPRP